MGWRHSLVLLAACGGAAAHPDAAGDASRDATALADAPAPLNSNPTCDYSPACALEPNLAGVAIYQMTYGDYQPGYTPAGC